MCGCALPGLSVAYSNRNDELCLEGFTSVAFVMLDPLEVGIVIDPP